MKDLKLSCDNENGERIVQEYDCIFDFTNAMEADDIDIPMMDYKNVEADFWENPLHHKHFDTIRDLYRHCKGIII